MWELAEKDQPFPALSLAQVIAALVAGDAPSISDSYPTYFKRLMHQCFQREAARPTFAEISVVLAEAGVQQATEGWEPLHSAPAVEQVQQAGQYITGLAEGQPEPINQSALSVNPEQEPTGGEDKPKPQPPSEKVHRERKGEAAEEPEEEEEEEESSLLPPNSHSSSASSGAESFVVTDMLTHFKEDLLRTTGAVIATGREAERRQLQTFLTYPAAERRLMLVRGGRGMGKTSLLRWVGADLAPFLTAGPCLCLPASKSVRGHAFFHRITIYNSGGRLALGPCTHEATCLALFRESYRGALLLIDDFDKLESADALRSLSLLPPSMRVLLTGRPRLAWPPADWPGEALLVELAPRAFLTCKLLGMSLDHVQRTPTVPADPLAAVLDADYLPQGAALQLFHARREHPPDSPPYREISRRLAVHFDQLGRALSPAELAELWLAAGSPGSALPHLLAAARDCHVTQPWLCRHHLDQYLAICKRERSRVKLTDWLEVHLLLSEVLINSNERPAASELLRQAASSGGVAVVEFKDWDVSRWDRAAAKSLCLGIALEMKQLVPGPEALRRALTVGKIPAKIFVNDRLAMLTRIQATTGNVLALAQQQHSTASSLHRLGDAIGFWLASYASIVEAYYRARPSEASSSLSQATSFREMSLTLSTFVSGKELTPGPSFLAIHQQALADLRHVTSPLSFFSLACLFSWV